MTDTGISIVIPARNEAAVIGPAIDRAAAGSPHEIIVVDGASTDGTAGAAVVTSARRWCECGILRTTVLNQACVVAYVMGVSPDRIAGWREKHSGDGRTGGVRGTGPSAPAATGSR